MPYHYLDLEHLHNIALKAAKRAGEYIATQSFQSLEVKSKVAGDSLASQLFTEVDQKSQQIILDALSPSCDLYEIGILAEETEDNGDRLEKDLFWAIDPLDGTLPFIDGIAGFAVSIALVTRKGKAIIGVVYDPVMGTSYSAIKGKGAWRDKQPLLVPSTPSGALLTWHMDRSMLKSNDFTTIKEKLSDLAQKIGYKGLRVESATGAVMHALSVVECGDAIYIKPPKSKAGGGSIWDFAATSIIAEEAGAIVRNFSNEPLFLNDPESTFMNKQGVVYGAHKDLVTQTLKVI